MNLLIWNITNFVFNLVNGLKEGANGAVEDADTKIDLLDGPKVVQKKIKAAFCEPGKVGDSGLFAIIKTVLFNASPGLEVKRKEEYGGNVFYDDYDKLVADFIEQVWTFVLLSVILLLNFECL